MTTATVDIHAELSRLEAAATAAHSDWQAAKWEMDRAVAGAIEHPAVVALRAAADATIFRKPSAPSPEAERDLVLALCHAIIANPDLTLTSLGASRFRVDDRGPERRAHEARIRRDEAAAERDAFKAAHAEEFAAAAKEAEQAATREALESGDPLAIREALGVEQETVALTTQDFFRPRRN